MFIELTTTKGEKMLFNTDNIVLISPEKKGTLIVDVLGMDWLVIQPYESIASFIRSKAF